METLLKLLVLRLLFMGIFIGGYKWALLGVLPGSPCF
jgi:hypothetical protein